MRTIPPGIAPPVRRGSTLTEVLVALMIMSIGLVSLATLFPLATLRAAKAVQITAATDLRYNADTLLTMYPQMITDPDLNPQTSNLPGFNQNSLNWVIDPIGFSNAAGLSQPLDVNKVAFADFYGHEGPLAAQFVRRYSFNRGNTGLSNDFAGLPDTVNILSEQRFSGALGGATEIVLAPGVINSLGVSDGRPNNGLRLTFFSADGRTSQSREVTLVDLSKNRLTWSEDVNGNNNLEAGEDLNFNGGIDTHPLPANFVVTSFRLESPETRYSWLLTVRRVNSGLAEVDVVVFFRRPPADPTDPKSDEQIYRVITTATINGKQETVGFLQNSPFVQIEYTGARPAVRKGGFLFDLGNARWYRITNILADTGSKMDLLIDPPAIVSSPRDSQQDLIGNLAIFPRGVVEVFSLGTRP